MAPVSVVLAQAPFAITTTRDLSPNTFLLPMNCPAPNPSPRVVVAVCFPSTTDRPVARLSSDGTPLRNDDVATTGGRDDPITPPVVVFNAAIVVVVAWRNIFL